MDGGMKFRIVVPPTPTGTRVQMSVEEAEKFMLEAVKGNGDRTEALWNLAQFYKVNGLHGKALKRLQELIELLPDAESKGECIFTMGQSCEGAGDFAAAVKYYRAAMAMEPASPFLWYFIHNNLGYSLNALGRFEEGELYCRRAIGIDPNRPNGHKNLGLALAGRGNYREAARCFVTATQVNAADGRSLQLLETLVTEHPELEFDFQNEIENCRAAVTFANEKLKASQPAPLTGWRKSVALLRVRIGRWWRRAG